MAKRVEVPSIRLRRSEALEVLTLLDEQLTIVTGWVKKDQVDVALLTGLRKTYDALVEGLEDFNQNGSEEGQ